MKTISPKYLVILLFSGYIGNSGWAFDDARHHFGSDYEGGRYGFGHGRFFLSPYYAYHPREEKKQQAPPVYIQRRKIELSATGIKQGFWHYCSNPPGYYPDVKVCSEDWLPVTPQSE